MSGSPYLRFAALTATMLLFVSTSLMGQTVFEIDNDFFIGTCDGILTDDGGLAGNHAAIGQQQITICSNSAQANETHIRLTFTEYEFLGTLQIYNSDFQDPGALFYEDIDSGEPLPIVVEASASNMGGGCLTIVFTPSGTGPGFAANIECIQSCQSVRAALDSSTPAVMPIDTGYIDLCFGDTVSLSGVGIYGENNIAYAQSDATSTFRWFMEDGTVLEGPNVSHVYQRAGGYLVQLQITDISGCVSINQINQRVRVAGTPTFPIQNDVPDAVCVNDILQLTASVEINPNDSSTVIAFSDTFFFSQPATVADSFYLPDLPPGQNSIEYSSTVEFSSFPFGSTVTSVDDILGFCVNMEHSFAGDLQIEMECPDGSVQVLHSFNSGLGGQYFGEAIDFDDSPNPGIGYDYCWRPESDRTIGEVVNILPVNGGESIPAGDYEPDEPFSNLLGCPLNGEWSLRVIDFLQIDNGFIFNWSIELASYLYPDIEEFSVPVTSGRWIENDNIDFYSPDSITSVPAFAGEAGYTFQVRDTFGCVNDTTLTVEVLPFSSPDCYECSDMLDSLEQTFANCSGGGIQTSLASRTSLDTFITWADFPIEEFSFETNPNPAQAFRSSIEVNSMRPALLNDATAQIRSVCLNIETPLTNQVTLFLEAPNGNRMLLVRDRGTTNNFTETCFTPTATNSILSGTNPFTGSFEPEGSWNDLNGTVVNGAWAIVAWDRAGFNSPGRFLDWSIEFNHENPITYSWFPTDGLSCTDCPAPTINTATSQVYTLTATDSYGCSETGTVAVEVTGFAYNFDSIVVDESCFGLLDGSIAITPNDATPVTFAWSNGPTTPDNPDLAAGDYVLTITNVAENCTNSYEFTIGEAPQIEIELIAVDSVSCSGASDGRIDIEATGGTGDLTYAWNDPNLQQVLQDAVSLEAGVYTVTVTDANNCAETFTATVVEPNEITIDFTPEDVACRGQNTGTALAGPFGGNGGYTFNWETGAETELATNLSAGSYSLTVTDRKGCTGINTVLIEEPITGINVSAIQDEAGCAGSAQNVATVTPLGGVGPYSFIWSNGETAATAENLPGGENLVLTTDAVGCVDSLIVTVQDLAPITFNLIDNRPTCSGEISGEMGFNQLMGGAPSTNEEYSYIWSDGQTSVVATNLQGGIEYSLTITDSQGCSGVASRLLLDPAPLSVNATGSSTRCFGFTDGTATVSNVVSPNLGDASILWNTAAGSSTEFTVENLAAGTYSFTVTDAAGCTLIDNVTVIQPTLLTVLLGQDNVTCFGDTDGGVFPIVQGGNPGYAFNWSNGATTSSIDQVAAGNYSVSVMDNNGCETIESIQITQPDPVIAVAESEPVICFGDATGQVTITANGGRPPFTYSIDNSGYSRGQEFIGLTAGDYTAYVRDVGGCIGSTQVTVSEGPVFVVNLGDDLSIEFGDSIRLSASFTGGADSLSFFWEGSYAGTLLCRGSDEPREASTVVTCEAPNVRPEYEIDYTLRLIDGNGCEAEDRVRVSVEKFRIVEVPTGFTPNDDGNNDLLMVHGRTGTKVGFFRIFDRWGELIHESGEFDVNDPTQGWDGRYKDELVNSGVYLWQLQAIYEDGSRETLSGETNLLR